MIYAVAAWTEKVSLSLCDRIFSVRDMSDYYNIDVRKTAVIDQGVDLESIEQSVPDLRHPESVPLVVNVGRLDSEKNLNVLIESVGLLANKRMRIKCLLVGWGPELEKLRMQVANASLNDRIQFLGRVPPERVPSILKTCDVFVLPSENEGVPAAVLEAMACRVPVIICLRSGPFSDSVKKSGAAMIVDCNAFAIANAIESILSNSDFRNGLRRAGVDFVASMYDNRVSRETFTRFLLDLDSSEVSGH